MTFDFFATMDLDDAHLLLLSDQNLELFVNTVEVSTSDEQKIESALNLNVSSPERTAHPIGLSYMKRRTKYDQISVVKVQDQIVSTKISSALDNSTCSTLIALGESNALHSNLQQTSKGADLVKSNVQTTRTVPNILRNTIPKESSSCNKSSGIDQYLKIDRNCAKTSIHKRKQVYSSSSIRQEPPDWLSDTFNTDNEKSFPNVVQKQTVNIRSDKASNKHKHTCDNKKANQQKNCFLPVANDGLLNSTNDTDLFGDCIFTENANNNIFNDLFNFSDETVIDNTPIEFGNSNYLEYSDGIAGSDKLDSFLNCTIDSYIHSDTCDFNANDIDTSRTISCTSDQCDQCDKYEDNIVNKVLLSKTETLEDFVEDSQLNITQTLKWSNQSKIDDYVTFDINDIQNECIIDSRSWESSVIQEILCDKYSNTLLDLTDMNEIKEMNSYGEEHEVKDMNMLNKDNSDSTENTKYCDKKKQLINGETYLQDSKDVSESIVSSREIKLRDTAKSDKNLVSRRRTTNTSNEKKMRNTAKFQCPLCPLYFRTQRTMAIHRAAAHGGMYVILCEHCGRLFNNKYHLNRHIINCRYAQRPFKCDHCDRYYRHKSSLVQHLRNVHKVAYTCNTQKQYTCDKCSKVYSKYGAFEKHISLHDQIELI